MSGSRESLMSAIRGPVMLITVGALFAIDHFGSFGIGRTWPVILIVLGLLKLAERATMGSTPAHDPTKGNVS
jgi:hypothetical protein